MNEIISFRKLSEFRKLVYLITKQIPEGKVSTYGEIAKVIHQLRTRATSARAVGTALKNNPYAPTVPCHRVIKSDNTLGGFFGVSDPASAEVQRKWSLLVEEGIKFSNVANKWFVCSSHIMSSEELLLNSSDILGGTQLNGGV